MARVLANVTSERTNRAMLAAAVLFAGLAALLVFVALRDRGASSTTSTPSSAAAVSAVVAARDIPANTKITADMLELRGVPDGALVSGAFARTNAVVGLATRYPIEAGEQITQQKVGGAVVDSKQDVALVVQPGQRGFAVAVTEVTSVGALLLPGYFVDVVAVFPANARLQTSQGAAADAGAMTLLQNVEVLAVAQEALQPVPSVTGAGGAGTSSGQGLSGQRPDNADRQPQARSVTLAVTPDQAQQLALVQQRGGTIWLSLRGAGDHEQVPVQPSQLNLLTGQPSDIQP